MPESTAEVLVQYAIYEHPEDYQQGYALRQWHITAGQVTAGPVSYFATLEEARAALPPGLTNYGRQGADDPVIREIWM